MDIYGYNALQQQQYERSEELAKQMFAQQALACRPMPEAHVMPTPSGAPWNVQSIPWGLPSKPQLVQFTGQPQSIEVPRYTPVMHCKRKSLDVVPVVPAKQLLTEEKMAAHLNSLHISPDFTEHTLASEELMDVGMEASTSATEKVKGTIVLSEELKRLQSEPLLPASLIERLEKPCMSLVVWKPKQNIIETKLQEAEEEEKQNNKTLEDLGQARKRIGLLVSDLGMDVEM